MPFGDLGDSAAFLAEAAFFGADAFFGAGSVGEVVFAVGTAAVFAGADFGVGAALFGAAGADSSALADGLRSRLDGASALFDEKKLATMSKICTTIPRARIPTVTPATSASGESIFNSAFLAAFFAVSFTTDFAASFTADFIFSLRVRANIHAHRFGQSFITHHFPFLSLFSFLRPFRSTRLRSSPFVSVRRRARERPSSRLAMNP